MYIIITDYDMPFKTSELCDLDYEHCANGEIDIIDISDPESPLICIGDKWVPLENIGE